ncbi:hypothetical protein BpHYR1_045275 [Brachionus plicatilis]|uniref:Uncharacterized protein n=1 Tax=Brachionus plicatilis TaxID=10195 RepID=A0A3M7QTQ5_BRAPC|nr:hypothetical protein BpHYR1_045275 [Brachionus plicatilis]
MILKNCGILLKSCVTDFNGPNFNSSIGMVSVKAKFDAINLDNINNDRNRIGDRGNYMQFLSSSPLRNDSVVPFSIQ